MLRKGNIFAEWYHKFVWKMAEDIWTKLRIYYVKNLIQKIKKNVTYFHLIFRIKFLMSLTWYLFWHYFLNLNLVFSIVSQLFCLTLHTVCTYHLEISIKSQNNQFNRRKFTKFDRRPNVTCNLCYKLVKFQKSAMNISKSNNEKSLIIMIMIIWDRG